MTIKTSAASVERDLPAARSGFKESAAAVKAAHRSARQAILDDARRSEVAKKDDLAALSKDTRAKLDGLKNDQLAYESGLRSKLEKELRGDQPSDANSVILRRDASDRARRIQDQQEALAVLNDAIFNGDEAMAHAVGNKARNSVWLDVAEAYQAAFPSTADSAAALSYVESNTSGAAWNLDMQMTYADPLD